MPQELMAQADAAMRPFTYKLETKVRELIGQDDKNFARDWAEFKPLIGGQLTLGGTLTGPAFSQTGGSLLGTFTLADLAAWSSGKGCSEQYEIHQGIFAAPQYTSSNLGVEARIGEQRQSGEALHPLAPGKHPSILEISMG